MDKVRAGIIGCGKFAEAMHFPNIAAYVGSWREKLQQDERAISEAAAAAQKAVEWLLAKAGLPLPD